MTMKHESERQEQEILDILQGIEPLSLEDRVAQQERAKAEIRTRWENAAQSQAPSPGDQELLSQCRGQDRNVAKLAFRQLVQRYQKYVYTYFMTEVAEQTAFEMTRDVFVQAYKHLEEFPVGGSMKAWLLGIARKKLLKVSQKSEQAWYLRLLPVQLYRRHLTRTQQEEQLESSIPEEKSDCALVRRQLSAYIDNELPSAAAEHLEVHLAGCLQCSQEYDHLLDTIEVARASGLTSAPANLLPAINVALEQETPFERLSAIFKKLTDIVPAPVFQVATITLGIVVILLGILHNSQQSYIQELETRNARLQATVRSLNREPVQDTMLNTFIIFTGAIVSEAMPPEAAQYVDTLLPEPENAPPFRMIPGDIESVRAKVKTYIASFHGVITEPDERIRHKTLNILKISAELPSKATSLLSLFLQQLESGQPEPVDGVDSTTILINIYIIDTLT